MPGFQLHPEVWLLAVALVGMGRYVTRVIGPKAVRHGTPVVTRRQVSWFALGVASLVAVSVWPVHDIAEERLYSVHMAQHAALIFVIAPVFLLATPPWFARLLVGRGVWLPRLCHPVVAGVLFNVVTILMHWKATVNGSVESAPLHFALHVLVVGTALLMWMPVCGPVPELRLSLPAQMVYLFLMTIIPTVPAAWLTMAEGVVYSAYDTPVRLWGMSATTDQQVAGLVMKLLVGFYLWGIIIGLFFKWAHRHMEADKGGRTLTERQILTWDDVKDELAPTGR